MGIVIPHLDSKVGMVGKFSLTAHLKAIEKSDLVTGIVWEVLPSHKNTFCEEEKVGGRTTLIYQL